MRDGWTHFRELWRTGPSSFGSQVALDQRAHGEEEIVSVTHHGQQLRDFGASLWAGALTELLMLLVGNFLHYTSQKLGAGGVLSSSFTQQSVSSDQAGCLRSCPGSRQPVN